ncbi:Flp family type IVb pilin [Burkholderia sp. MR1-5-21]
MSKIVQQAQKFLRDEQGVTAIEYGLLASLVAVALIAGATLLGSSLNTLFSSIGTKLG